MTTRIPAGYRAVPVDEGSEQAVVRLCVLTLAQPAPGQEPFVLLRATLEAHFYLGCLVDRAGRWLEWVEIAVQHHEGLSNTPTAFREILNNHILDARWAQRCQGLRELQPDEVVVCGYELEPPPAWYYDPAQGRMVPLGNAQGPWQLCRDDAALVQAGLPPYSSSLARYLRQPEAAANGFLPATKNSVINENTVELADALPPGAHLVPFNPACGLMEVRRFHPLGYEDYVDVLSGHSWRGIRRQGQLVEVNESWPALAELAGAQPAVFLAATTLEQRLAEVFYLKLHLFCQAVRWVWQITRRTQLPLLNLGGESFRVRFESPHGALPLGWCARCNLLLPGQAVALRARDAGQRFFMRLGGPAQSIYLPAKVGQMASGLGEVRLRGVVKEQDKTVVRGTLVLRQPVNVSASDILWLRLTVAGGSFDFFGHVYPEEALSRLDLPFRTWPLALEEEDEEQLQTAVGQFNLPPAPFEVIPMLSSAVDMHSLAVLAVRTFLTPREVGFQEAVDDVLSLARAVAMRHQAGLPVMARIQSLLAESSVWLKAFGPHNLVADSLTPDQAFAAVPPNLWWELVALMVEMLPAMGPDSLCQDYGGVPPEGLETIYEAVLRRLEPLLLAARARVLPGAAAAPGVAA
ncbi:MAG: hypothetical protein N3J91_00135 [Verrucomicrobiae bacterium]|nr:hypothetical protein [Verrucomicrobiae bacterium]